MYVTIYRTKRPVRCVFDRATDMRTTGKRHPIKALYKVRGHSGCVCMIVGVISTCTCTYTINAYYHKSFGAVMVVIIW